MKFIKKTNKIDIIVLKIITIAVIIIGSIMSSNTLWAVVDILVGLLAIINIYALFRLRNIVFDEYKTYKLNHRKYRVRAIRFTPKSYR